MEEGYKKTDENITLNGRNYSIYINKDNDRSIEINGLLYPELNEWQEKFHRVYKPKLAIASNGLVSLVGLTAGTLLVKNGLENISSDISANHSLDTLLDAFITVMGVSLISYGVAATLDVIRRHNPYKK